MNKNFLSVLTLVIFSFLFWASGTSTKHLASSETEREKGKFTLSYTYSKNESHKVDWKEARQKALVKCRKWGFSDVGIRKGGTKECLDWDEEECDEWKVTYDCDCLKDTLAIDFAVEKQVISSGSGFAVSTDGIIATSYHLVKGADEIRVKGINGEHYRSYDAKILLKDKNNGLALIRIDDPAFTAIDDIPYEIFPRTMKVGSRVYGLGYPSGARLGDDIALCEGMITSKVGIEGSVSSYQTTTAIYPGYDGGPLFNKHGQVVGIMSATKLDYEKNSYAVKSSYLRNLQDLLPDEQMHSMQHQASDTLIAEHVEMLKKFTFIVERD